ncbi:hypothetical protein OROGR_004410 [Orobanche gracilis]
MPLLDSQPPNPPAHHLGSHRRHHVLSIQPKLPKYSVGNLRISDLTLNFDMSLYTRFNVRITAANPNKMIGIYYEKGGHLSEVQKDKSLPRITAQILPHNKTLLNIGLIGQNQYGRTTGGTAGKATGWKDTVGPQDRCAFQN